MPAMLNPTFIITSWFVWQLTAVFLTWFINAAQALQIFKSANVANAIFNIHIFFDADNLPLHWYTQTSTPVQTYFLSDYTFHNCLNHFFLSACYSTIWYEKIYHSQLFLLGFHVTRNKQNPIKVSLKFFFFKLKIPCVREKEKLAWICRIHYSFFIIVPVTA